MVKINCWEQMKCGREPGGNQNKELGVCPASTEKRINGVNGGINAGRACWAIPDTNCGFIVDEKLENCLNCDFFKLVEYEEDRDFIVMGKIVELLG